MRRISRHAVRGVLAAAALISTGCSGILEVEDPQAFGDADLNSPVIIKNVAEGAEGSLRIMIEQRVDAAAAEGTHEGVVVEARAADAAAGPGGHVDDPHARRPSRWMSTSARSAGVMPLTRPAWPSVRGLIRASCSRASARR